MANQIGTQKDDICASLHIKPYTEEELRQREFLKNTSMEGISRFLFWLEKDGKIYERNGVYHVYKKTVIELNKKGYELE